MIIIKVWELIFKAKNNKTLFTLYQMELFLEINNLIYLI